VFKIVKFLLRWNLSRHLDSVIKIFWFFIEIDFLWFGEHFGKFLNISHELMKFIFLLNFLFLKILIIRKIVFLLLLIVLGMIMIVFNFLSNERQRLASLLFNDFSLSGWRLGIWLFRYEYFHFEILTWLLFFGLFLLLLRHIHLNRDIFFLSYSFIFPRFHWLLLFYFCRRLCLKNSRNLLVRTFLQFMRTFWRIYFCLLWTFLDFDLFLFSSSLNDRCITFFLRSSLICLRISYLLSYFSFLAFSFISLSLFSAFSPLSIFSSFLTFSFSLRSCYFCSCFEVNLSCYSLESSLNMNGFIKIASIDGLFFWSTCSICRSNVLISLE